MLRAFLTTFTDAEEESAQEPPHNQGQDRESAQEPVQEDDSQKQAVLKGSRTSTPSQASRRLTRLKPALGSTSTTINFLKRSHEQVGGSTSSRSQCPKGPENADSDQWANNPWVRSAGYALETLSHGGFREHVIGALVTADQWIQLVFFDRSAIVYAEPFDFIAEPRKLLVDLQKLPNHDPYFHILKYARCPTPSIAVVLMPGEHTKDPFHPARDLRVSLANEIVLGFNETVVSQRTIVGRVTATAGAQAISPAVSGDAQSKDLVIKSSWPTATRIIETTMVNEARQNSSNFLLNLSNFLHSEEYPVSELSQRLFAHFASMPVVKRHEVRQLRLAVSERIFPISRCPDAKTLLKCSLEILRCHRHLHDNVHILHISVNNLMLRKQDNDYVGVLIDFDLCTKIKIVNSEVMPQSTSSSTTRTGTWPYMAVDLHYGKSPLYRHDLESLFYVLVEEASLPAFNPMQDWNTQAPRQLVASKAALISMEANAYSDELVQDKYKGVGYHIGCIQAALRQGALAQANNATAQKTADRLREQGKTLLPFDEATQGGHVTFDIYENTLQEPLSV